MATEARILTGKDSEFQEISRKISVIARKNWRFVQENVNELDKSDKRMWEFVKTKARECRTERMMGEKSRRETFYQRKREIISVLLLLLVTLRKLVEGDPHRLPEQVNLPSGMLKGKGD